MGSSRVLTCAVILYSPVNLLNVSLTQLDVSFFCFYWFTKGEQGEVKTVEVRGESNKRYYIHH